MTDLDVIDGGEGTPQQPNWQLLSSDVGECGAAAGHWSNIVNAMRSAETLSVANGHAIKRLVIAQIVFDRACAAVARVRLKIQRYRPTWLAAISTSTTGARIVHVSHIANADILKKDQSVSFEFVTDARTGKPRADRVRVP
jgi:cold shock CspA family protein